MTTVIAVGSCFVVFAAWLVLPHRASTGATAEAPAQVEERVSITAA